VGRLIYGAICSLDGYTEDRDGTFGWAAPDEEVHSFVNDLERPIGTYLYGRRMYETMAVWETDPSFAQDDAVMRDYAAIWQAADKIVYSKTLERGVTGRTRIESAFAPDTVAEIKSSTAADLSIGGPELAAHALRAGLVDEIRLFLAPVAVGGGKPALPPGLRLDLGLLEERGFAGGFLYARYELGPRA
jgi:dihydrofolate reductase